MIAVQQASTLEMSVNVCVSREDANGLAAVVRELERLPAEDYQRTLLHKARNELFVMQLREACRVRQAQLSQAELQVF